jgi:hypothetical protein
MSNKIDLAKGPIGADGDFDLEIENGQLVLEVSYDGEGVDGTLRVSVDGLYFMDKLKGVIPGTIDDAVIELLKNAIRD